MGPVRITVYAPNINATATFYFFQQEFLRALHSQATITFSEGLTILFAAWRSESVVSPLSTTTVFRTLLHDELLADFIDLPAYVTIDRWFRRPAH